MQKTLCPLSSILLKPQSLLPDLGGGKILVSSSLLPSHLSLLSFLMKFLVFHGLEFSLTIFAIALCDLFPILPNSHHLQFHRRRASSTSTNCFLHRDLFWVSILAPLELKLSSSVKLAPHHASPPFASVVLLIVSIRLSSFNPCFGVVFPTPLHLVLSFGFGFMFILFMLFLLELVCEDFYCLMLVCFSNGPISNAFSAFLPLAFFWMSCLLLACGYFRVSLSFAFVTAFSGSTGEARIFYDSLSTICVYFLHCAFCFVCIVGEHTPYLMF